MYEEKYLQKKSKYPVLEGRCWTIPSLADGRVYVRNESELVCLDMRGDAR